MECWSDGVLEYWDDGCSRDGKSLLHHFNTPSLRFFMSDLDCDIYACRQIEFLQLVHRLCSGFDDINESLVSALLEGFLRFLVRVRRALHSEALHASRQGDRSGNTRPGAFDRVSNVAGRLVYDPMVIGLESNSDALSSHTKNNCLLMVYLTFCRSRKEQDVQDSRSAAERNFFFAKPKRLEKVCHRARSEQL
jgi:hypothetical protein